MYLSLARRVWKCLPAAVRTSAPGTRYGLHVHALICRRSERRQSFGTFFLRNRAEMELMCWLLNEKPQGARVDLCVLACSKGAELYSILWAIRSARPDLNLNVHALDISREILEFARGGVYSLRDSDQGPGPNNGHKPSEVSWNTWRDQIAPIFERMTKAEIHAMCEIEGEQVRIREWLKEGITWVHGDAADANVVKAIGVQDIVVANRFLCHMRPEAAARGLRNVAKLVKPGGYLFVTGVDLDVRASVAREMGWMPVTEMIREVHEGDVSLLKGWPLEYWGLEPFSDDRADWETRYAAVFRVGQPKSDERHESRAQRKQAGAVFAGK
jgi:SAM-dependent methyltransferase